MCQFPLESSLEDRDDDDDVRGMTSYTSTRLNQIHIQFMCHLPVTKAEIIAFRQQQSNMVDFV